MSYRSLSYAIVGLGPVGSRLGKAVGQRGHQVLGYDVDPNAGDGFVRARSLAEAVASADRVIVAVPSSSASAVATEAAAAMKPRGVYEDWASSPSNIKAGLADLFRAGQYTDVTLLDSITASQPLACVAGTHRATVAREMEELGFEMLDAGERPGAAATVKMVRSLFMKPLEVLAIEVLLASECFESTGTALYSIEKTLQMPFRDLARMLLQTNQRHADRRAEELGEVLASVALPSSAPVIEACRAALVALAEKWALPDAPPPDAEPSALLAYLASTEALHAVD